MICGIYKISLNDGRCYVGSSSNDLETVRWRHHRSLLRTGKHHSSYLQNAWNKYGENAFTFSIIEECNVGGLTKTEVKSLLKEREQFWMDELEPEFNALPAAWSHLGAKRSLETRARMSAVKMGNTGRLGMPHTPETRAKQSESAKARGISQETRAKMNESKRGKPLSAEHRAALSAARKGKPGRIPTSEARANMSAAQKGRPLSPSQLASHYINRPGWHHTEESKAKISAAQKARRKNGTGGEVL